MLSMHSFLQRLRQLLLALLFILAIAWLFGFGAQWLLRWRAEKLLADIAPSTRPEHLVRRPALIQRWYR